MRDITSEKQDRATIIGQVREMSNIMEMDKMLLKRHC